LSLNVANMTWAKLNTESETLAQLVVLPCAYIDTLPLERGHVGALQMFVTARMPVLETATSTGYSPGSVIVIVGLPV
jgi:hypothetical protein